MPSADRAPLSARAVVGVMVWAACLLALLQLVSMWWSGHRTYPCRPDNEGQWSIGIFKGPSPFHLQPLEFVQPPLIASSAWPVSNPVYTCAHVEDKHSSFVADPFLWPMKDGKTIYMFYETKSLSNMQGDIGAAISYDGGLSFSHVGVVLDEPWHLSYPYLVEDGGKMYMIPEGSTTGALRVYEATDFPSRWAAGHVLIDQPLIDASFFQHDGRWWLFASNRREKSSKNCRELEIWYADRFLGPWTRHPQSPVRAWVQGSRQAGRPIKVEGLLYRFGQDCELTYGHKVRAFRVKTLTITAYDEEEVPFGIPGSRRPGVDWNGQRYHHIDAHQLSDGQWIAAMDGDKYVSDYISQRWLLRLPWLIPSVIVFLATCGFVLYSGGVAPAVTALCPPAITRFLCGCCAPHDVEASMRRERARRHHSLHTPLSPRPSPRTSGFGSGSFGSSHGWGSDHWGRSGSHGGGVVSLLYDVLSWRLPVWRIPGFCSVGGCTLGHMLVLAAVLSLLPWFVWTFCRMQPASVPRAPGCCGASSFSICAMALVIVYPVSLAHTGIATAVAALTPGSSTVLAGLLWYVRTFSASPEPELVDGMFSKFSILVMSYEARLITLQAFVGHYSRCNSVGEIVVVWNKGTPPDPYRDLHSWGVPVRVRVEEANSMNNRFRPDPELRNRGILMLDDDIIMPCADIERGFSKWRQTPERVTGFYARILEGDPPQYQCLHGCERYTFIKGVYNIVLAGAAFMDSHFVFPLYYSPENEQGRAYVDQVFNCDDLLLNYLLAAKLKGKQHAQYVRPSKRFDVGRLTSKRLSSGNFGPVRHNCTRDFATLFGNPLKDLAIPIDWDGMGQPVCGPSWLGCLMII